MSGWRLVSKRGRRQELLWRQGSRDLTFRQHGNSLPSAVFRHMQAQDVLFSSNLCEPAGLDAQPGSLDVEMVRGGFNSHWSLPDDAGSDSPAGSARRVTAETVSKLCDEGRVSEAVEALGLLVQTGCCVSKYLFYAVLKKCAVEKDLVLGRRVHALTIRGGCDSDTFLCNHMLRMYAAHGRLQDAIDVFAVVAEPDAFMWSSMISAHVKHGQDKQAVQLYRQMRWSRVRPDGHVFVAALQACARGSDLESGQQVHADVLAGGVECDMFVCNCLVSMYAKCGRLEEAQRVFEGLGQKDVASWNALIAGYSQRGMGHEALCLYSAMQEDGMPVPDSVTFVSLLQACANVGTPALERGKELDAQIREQGHEVDVFVTSSLVNMYAKCGSLEDAQRVFAGLGQKDVVTWNTMISGYLQQGMSQEALCLYSAMQQEGIAEPDCLTFVRLLQACAIVGKPALEKGKQLHVQIRVQGHEADAVVATNLVNMYAKCGSLEDARTVFQGLSEKDVVTWTAIISGYTQQGKGQEALHLYSTMQQEGIAVADCVTFVCLLQACATVGSLALETGKQLHAQIREQGHQVEMSVANSLVNMYAKCGSLVDARSVFEELGEKDLVTWNTMIAGYSQQGMGQEALHLFTAMQEHAIAVLDSVTFVCLLQACASVGTPALEKGKQLHAQIAEPDVFVGNSLVHMYAKCGSLEDAEKVFEGLHEKDVVTWTAMIAGYSQQGMGQEALQLYSVMQGDGITVPDCVTFVCLLQACANVAAVHLGRQLHAQIEEKGLQRDPFVTGSLINMYGKSGSMVEAQQVFDALPKRDDVSWSVLIAGYTCQGDSESVFDLVEKMKQEAIQPVSITFLCVLTVCCHGGLVNKGREYFECMSRHHGITPTVEHYTCMVDLLGRAGHLDEALRLVWTMPVVPNAAVFHTLLAACQKWSNVEVGHQAFVQALKLDKKDSAAYALMSNIYRGAEMWKQAQETQARRMRIRAWKPPGQSWWTDSNGLVHSFLVEDRKHPKSPARRRGDVLYNISLPAD